MRETKLRWIILGSLQRDKVGNPKENQPWIFTGRTDAEVDAPYLGHLMWRANSLEKTLMLGKIEGRRWRGPQRIRWLDGITKLNEHEFVQTPGDGKGQGNLACCSPLGRKESDTTEPLNNKFLIVQEDRDQAKDNELWSWGGSTESEFCPAEAAVIYGTWHQRKTERYASRVIHQDKMEFIQESKVGLIF